MAGFVKRILSGVLILALLLGAGLWWATGGRGSLREVLESPSTHLGVPSATRTAKPGELRAVTWNIAYGRGVKGDKSGPWSRNHILEHLDAIAAAIADMNVDIAALQEVDLDSARSHHIHEGRYLAEKLGWAHFACVVTWQQNYIPFPYWPPARHYGKMRSGQCVLSRFPITRNIRYRLAQPEENPAWYNLFYLHRAIQSVSLDVAGEEIQLFNIHLEAFNARNRQKQMEFLLHLLPNESQTRAVVLGDFNALPPEAIKRHAFPDEPGDDYRNDPTMSLMGAREDFSESLRTLHGQEPNGHLTFPADTPNRRLDYLFFSKRFTAIKSEIPGVGPLSDHLPVTAHLGL